MKDHEDVQVLPKSEAWKFAVIFTARTQAQVSDAPAASSDRPILVQGRTIDCGNRDKKILLLQGPKMSRQRT